VGETLHKRGADIGDSMVQLKKLSSNIDGVDGFSKKLSDLGIDSLKPNQLEILQINLGYMCNMTCEHCHVDAGPDRKEMMSHDVLESCLETIDSTDVHTVDLTGGAPEMHPEFQWFVKELSKRSIRVIVRSNLTILVSGKKFKKFPQFFADHNLVVIASLPCYTKGNTDKQRGDGAFNNSIKALLVLNELGYGKKDKGLELDLVFNPGGASLPGEQKSLEVDYKKALFDDFKIEFNSLFTITNLPISRFLDYLLVIGKYESYMKLLSDSFNPESINGLMCKNTLSVRWDGNLYDCDFNQMLELKVASSIGHISEFNNEQLLKRDIMINNHCLGCTAGAGSSCQGSLV
jgi:radical SAM/Cys-rich protein